MGSFTPLVFGTNGGMGADCNCFLKRLAEKLSEKNDEPYHITITWIRTSLSFEILRSVHTCARGSRAPFHRIPQGDFIDDCRLNAGQACVRLFSVNFFFLFFFFGIGTFNLSIVWNTLIKMLFFIIFIIMTFVFSFEKFVLEN